MDIARVNEQMDEGGQWAVPSSPGDIHSSLLGQQKTTSNLQKLQECLQARLLNNSQCKIGPAHSDELWLEGCSEASTIALRWFLSAWVSSTQKTLPHSSPLLLQTSVFLFSSRTNSLSLSLAQPFSALTFTRPIS